MHLALMRKVDDILGGLLCKLISIYFFIKSFLFSKSQNDIKKNTNTILLQKYFGLGSILHIIPLLKGLREKYPNAKIIFISEASNKDLLNLLDVIDEVKLIRFNSKLHFFTDLVKTCIFLVKEKIDISIDLEFFAKFTLLIACISGAKNKLGFYQNKIRPNKILTHKVYYNHYKHISEIFFSFGKILGLENKKEFFENSLPEFDQNVETEIKKKFKINTKKIITIIPSSSHMFTFKRWPLENFIELIQKLQKNHPDFHYIIVGQKSEKQYLSLLLNNLGENIIDCVGKTTFKELLVLLKISDLVISNDTGPMHIASLYNKNLVTFFGPETKIVYGPQNKNSLIFYKEKYYCSPCMNVYDSKKTRYGEVCTDNKCLSEITPEEVFNQTQKVFLQND